jgi:Kef-type K+ transport system membrane component KefB
MKDFILRTLAYSTKRCISVFAAILLAAVIICALCGVSVPDIIYYVLSGIILGNGTMTLFQNKKGGTIPPSFS